LSEVLAQLAGGTQPALQPARASAAALLAVLQQPLVPPPQPHPSGSAGPSLGGAPLSSSLSSAGHLATSAAGRSAPGAITKTSLRGLPHGGGSANSSVAGGTRPGSAADEAGGLRGSASGSGGLPARQVPALSPLGEFLLGRWQVEDARERVLLARTGVLSPTTTNPGI
jgi:hypothetical protein